MLLQVNYSLITQPCLTTHFMKKKTTAREVSRFFV